MTDTASSDSSAEPIIGIDLGTTNSLAAYCDERGPRILVGPRGDGMVPSVVRLGGDLEAPIVGREAREHAVEFPRHTISSVKRLMGRSLADVADLRSFLGYEIVEGEQETARVRVDDRVYAAEEISAMILRRLKADAEHALGRAVTKAVVTVPAYFDDAQRQATRAAGRIAGLEVVRIVNEPTAAALAYGIGAGRREEVETIAVYDLGGGTFDVSLLQVVPGEAEDEGGDGGAVFRVLSTAGDTRLGGDDVDALIVDLVTREIRARFGTTLEFPPSTRQALRRFAEATKIRLGEADEAHIAIDLGDGRTYERTLRRDEFESMVEPWTERTLDACRRALRDADLEPASIDRVILVGGSTRIPSVRERVGAFFGTTPYIALDPDRVVALGAAVQASIVGGTSRDALLLDVIPLSIGIETYGGAVAKLVLRNSTVPCRATEMFSTRVDGQTSIDIHVVQGERELVKDCRSLGRFDLAGIPPMPAGIPQVEVTFHVDRNGILDVAAHEKRSGRRASIQVVPHHGLTSEEVDAMERESFEHARADMTAHRLIDLRVNAGLDVKWIRERLDALGDEVPADYRADLERGAAELDDFIARSEDPADTDVDPDAFHRAKEDLDRASMRLHEISIAASLRADEDASGS